MNSILNSVLTACLQNTRVLLDDDFDQYVETSGSPKENVTKSDNSSVKQPTNTTNLYLDDAPIDGLQPTTSSRKLLDKVAIVLPLELICNFVSFLDLERITVLPPPHQRQSPQEEIVREEISGPRLFY